MRWVTSICFPDRALSKAPWAALCPGQAVSLPMSSFPLRPARPLKCSGLSCFRLSTEGPCEAAVMTWEGGSLERLQHQKCCDPHWGSSESAAVQTRLPDEASAVLSSQTAAPARLCPPQNSRGLPGIHSLPVIHPVPEYSVPREQRMRFRVMGSSRALRT